MATYTLYGDTGDGDLYAGSATYLTARAGSGIATFLNGNSSAVLDWGQEKSGATYYCYEAFIKFDTSSVVGTVTSVTLSLYIYNDQSATDFTMEARVHPWGSVGTGDWVAGASLSSGALRASLSTASITPNAYNDFTSDSSFVSNATNPQLILCSDRHGAGTAPTGREYVGADSADGTHPPKLTIVTTGGGSPSSRRRPSGLYVR